MQALNRYFLCLIFSSVMTTATVHGYANNVMLDRKVRNEKLSKFRSVKGGYRKRDKGDKSPSLEGLKDLNASASGQPNVSDLHQIANTIPKDMCLIVADLRREKHGFVNGEPVVWKFGEKEMISREFKLTLQERAGRSYCVANFKLSSEQEEIAKLGIGGVAFPTKDHHPPTDEVIQKFVDFAACLDANAWVHFHCKGGAGRATTFMIMFDMLHNADRVSKDDIIRRQFLIGGAKIAYCERYCRIRDFLDKFYIFSQQKLRGNANSWQEFLASNRRLS